MNQRIKYGPEPGGDFVIHLGPSEISVVHHHGERTARILHFPLAEDELPPQLYWRTRQLFDVHEPERVIVSVSAVQTSAHLLFGVTRFVRALVRPHPVPVLEIPDIIAVAHAVEHGDPQKRPPTSVGPPPRKPTGPPGVTALASFLHFFLPPYVRAPFKPACA